MQDFVCWLNSCPRKEFSRFNFPFLTFTGENINICWSPDGQTIAVGNKDDVVTFIDAKTYRSKAEEQFKFEVNEISWNNDNNMFFLTNGNGCINILRYPHHDLYWEGQQVSWLSWLLYGLWVGKNTCGVYTQVGVQGKTASWTYLGLRTRGFPSQRHNKYELFPDATLCPSLYLCFIGTDLRLYPHIPVNVTEIVLFLPSISVIPSKLDI